MGSGRTQTGIPASHPSYSGVALQPTALGLGGGPASAAEASQHEYPGMTMSGGLGTTHVGAGGTTGLALPGDGVAGPTQVPVPIFPMPFMGQIPQIPRFTGEGHASSDSFSEWHEHFENIAKLVGWDDHWRLVHLTSNLRDTAASFYRSCGVDVRSNYRSQVAAMKRRFTPIRLTAIQAQHFHNRQQSEKETVDQFAQELRKLLHLAYVGAACEGPQAERMGQTLLTNQFVSGLRSDLKRKLIGVEGGLEELILKARFEEAKGRELIADGIRSHPAARSQRPVGGETLQPAQPTSTTQTRGVTSGPPPPKGAKPKCFNCGLEGHIARACPYPRKGRRDEEARGQRRGTMSALVGEGDDVQKEIEELKQKLHCAQLKAAVGLKSQVMNTMAAEGVRDNAKLGPSVFTEVRVNGVPAKALVDTGSPATIVSLEFILDVFAAQRGSRLTPELWTEETLKKFSPPDVVLKAYGGQPLDILSQVRLTLSLGDRALDTTVLVQKGAPNQLLLGTDVQPKLGFALVVETEAAMKDLLTGEEHQEDQESVTPARPQAIPPKGLEEHQRKQEQDLQTQEAASGGLPSVDQASPPRYDKTPGNIPISATLGPSSAGGRDQPGTERVIPGGEEEDGSPKTVVDAPPKMAASGIGGSVSTRDGQVGVVRLLRTEKLRPGQKKMIRARIQGEVEAALLLFTPKDVRGQVLLADAAIEGAHGSCTTLIIQNGSHEEVCLKGGTTLGTVVPVEEVEQSGSGTICANTDVSGGRGGESIQSTRGGAMDESGQVAALASAETAASRRERLTAKSSHAIAAHTSRGAHHDLRRCVRLGCHRTRHDHSG